MPLSANLLKLESSFLPRAKRVTSRSNVATEKRISKKKFWRPIVPAPKCPAPNCPAPKRTRPNINYLHVLTLEVVLIMFFFSSNNVFNVISLCDYVNNVFISCFSELDRPRKLVWSPRPQGLLIRMRKISNCI